MDELLAVLAWTEHEEDSMDVVTRLTRQRVRLLALLPATCFLGVVVPAKAAWAGSAIPNPPADGTAPGAELVGQVLGWLKWGGLTAALAGLLIGAITTGVGHFGSNYGASSAGRKWLLGGMGAAILSGLAWTIATTLYAATGG
jgi:hypothetical protein